MEKAEAQQMYNQAVVERDGTILFVYSFDDSTAGQIALLKWNRMTTEEKEATGMMGKLLKNSSVFLLPGIMLSVIFSDGTVKQIVGTREMSADVANRTVPCQTGVEQCHEMMKNLRRNYVQQGDSCR